MGNEEMISSSIDDQHKIEALHTFLKNIVLHKRTEYRPESFHRWSTKSEKHFRYSRALKTRDYEGLPELILRYKKVLSIELKESIVEARRINSFFKDNEKLDEVATIFELETAAAEVVIAQIGLVNQCRPTPTNEQITNVETSKNITKITMQSNGMVWSMPDPQPVHQSTTHFSGSK